MPRGFPRLRSQTLQPWIALLISVAVSLVLMAISGSRGNELARTRTAELLSTLARPFGIFPAVIHLAGENARLRAENTHLRLRALEAEEAMRENERFRDLLQFKKLSPFDLQAAEVIADNPMPDVHSLLVDVGDKQAVRKHQAVINDRGLVGKLVQIGERISIVQLLLDRNLGAAVRLATCRVNGITSWAGGDKLLIENIPSSAPVRLGEQVITSGLDGVFPAGIPVGEVSYTEKRKEGLFLKVEVDPYVDFSLLEEVFIVRSDSANSPTP